MPRADLTSQHAGCLHIFLKARHMPCIYNFYVLYVCLCVHGNVKCDSDTCCATKTQRFDVA